MVYPVLEGKTAIITGAAAGMGKATAELFAEAKANVVVADYNAQEGQKTADEICAKGGKAIFVKVDISKPEQVEHMVQIAVDTFGSLDCAVNNAAAAPDGLPIVDFDEAHWDRVANVDMKGTALCLKYEMRQMAKQGGGAIVNIASAITEKVQPNDCAYVSAKCGVRGLTRVAAIEGGKDQIRINSVCPGIIQTAMLDSFCIDHGIDPVEFGRGSAVLGRLAQPIEVAKASLWLCTDDASYVTATNITVDGGYCEI